MKKRIILLRRIQKNPFPPRRNSYLSFTLIELLMIMAIIALLVSMLFPALKKARETANRITCTNNMKNVGLATTMYVTDNEDYLPIYDWTGSHFYKFLTYLGIPYKNTKYYFNYPSAMKFFSCPSVKEPWNINHTYGTAPASFSGLPLAYSYAPTLTAYNQSAIPSTGRYGGVIAYFQASNYGACKRFNRVSENSVIMIEEPVSGCAVAFTPNYVFANGYYSLSYWSESPYYPSDSGASYHHGKRSNFLYEDGSVRLHPLGTTWNSNWQVE